MSVRFVAPLGVLSLALLLGVGTLVSRANEKRTTGDDPVPAAGSTAVVDMTQIYVASGGPRELADQADAREKAGVQRIEQIAAANLLNQNELQEYGNLVGKDKRTDAEDARIKALKALNDQRVTELQTLRAKQDASAADKLRLKELQDMSHLMDTVLPGLRDDFRGQQEVWVDAYRRQQLSQLRGVVAKVAKAKGVANVFDSNALVYSNNDLTAAVIQQVKKQK